MSTVSGTESLGFLQNLGLNTTQGKTSEDGAGLFAAMLQGLPTEADATAAASDDAVPLADASAAIPTANTDADDAALELIDDVALPQTATASLAVEDVEAEESMPAAGTQQAVQFFEDQLALQRRFATSAKTAEEKPAATVSLQSEEVELKDTSAAKGRKQLAADTGAAAVDTEVPTPKAEKNSRTDRLMPADYAAQNDGDTESAKPQALVASASAAIIEDTAVYTADADNAVARGATKSVAGPPLNPGPPSFAANGKGVPQSGKSLPNGKDDAGIRGRDQGEMILAGFTEVAGLEDSGLSFDDIAHAFLGAKGAENNQAMSSAATATGFAIDNGPRESLAESAAPDLLPDSATTTLESESTMGSYEWVEDTATQLSLLREQGVEKAHIKLHPEDLGTLDISITVNEGQAYVQFVTSTPEARELLQNSLPNLREMLQHSGLALAEGSVAQGDARKGRDFEHNPQQQNRFTDAPEAQPQNNGWMRPAAHSRSRIDYYI